MNIEFSHRQSAHCESGVTANVLSHSGYEMSEALAFGIGGGLFFGYFPFVRINKLPLITFRTSPGAIFKKTAGRLGVPVRVQRFRREEAGMQALDAALEQGHPVVLQTGVYWLPYFPPAFRFHFNAHNLVVYGRDGEEYLISDPVFDKPVRCHRNDLQRARFAKGALAPRGRMSYLQRKPEEVDLPAAVLLGIKEVAKRMVGTPLPFMGTRGIHLLANRLERWPEKLGTEGARQHLGHLIRMQEEIGTGGGGFRFIYAAFLQEAADILKRPQLAELSAEMTEIGDLWRYFALLSARNCKGREGASSTYPALAAQLHVCADREDRLFRQVLECIA
ncbi:BtrH N-terminal domain-containing protein [Desulfotalea psychrophila]|uniref:Butirosin biosynthesis protein H N-terminal domain-containing protein n=1 Tax=Desulfotalea psychrophila (strain LSv54 / DSM 12343) TaxID=177439 RepID=Q6AM58_DESPS|nr:BtrH N-terminal domain-containing protein [Desulfotalea psychrophila]CAG36567.1 hypothetical protein DP1838 [Desulfotalea psychrophila LSv54]